MTTPATTRTRLFLLATVLLAVVQMPRMSLAEDTGGAAIPAPSGDSADHAGGTGDSGSAKTDAVPAKPDSSKPESGSPAGGHDAGGKSVGGHTNATVNDSSHRGQAHSTEPIDAHIIPPTRRNENRFSARETKSKFKISTPGFQQRSTIGRPSAGPGTRNSIGLALPPQSGKQDRENKVAVPTAGPAPSASPIAPVKTEPTVDHTLAARPNISAPIGGSTIGGNANIRRGSNPGVLGGQTKAVAGINGSTIIHRTR